MAARTLRGRGRRRIGEDVGDGRARDLPRDGRDGGLAGRSRGRDAGQRALPHVHEQGHREPDPQDAQGAPHPRAGRGRGTRDLELPRVRRPGARTPRDADRARTRPAGAQPGAARADRGPGARPDDVRDAPHAVAARDRRLHPGSGPAAPEPPRRTRDRDRARRGQARRARQGEVGGALRGRAGADRDRPGGSGVPRPQGGARRDRFRRPDRARGPHRVGPPGGGQGLPGAVRGRAARRVPGHEPRPGGADARRVRRRPSR